MSATIFRATLRQRFTSPLRLLFLVFLGAPPLLAIVAAPRIGFTPLADCYMIALVLAAGMIGQEVASGTLQLTLARPVTRAQYVIGRWTAVVAATVAVVVVQVAIASLLMKLRGAPVPWSDAALALGNAVLVAAGAAAVIALFSSLVPGIGDLGVLCLVFVSSQILEGAGRAKGWDALVRAAVELQGFIKPEFQLRLLADGNAALWLALVSYLSTVTICLALAVMVMNRRELSYASTG